MNALIASQGGCWTWPNRRLQLGGAGAVDGDGGAALGPRRCPNFSSTGALAGHKAHRTPESVSQAARRSGAVRCADAGQIKLVKPIGVSVRKANEDVHGRRRDDALGRWAGTRAGMSWALSVRLCVREIPVGIHRVSGQRVPPHVFPGLKRTFLYPPHRELPLRSRFLSLPAPHHRRSFTPPADCCRRSFVRHKHVLYLTPVCPFRARPSNINKRPRRIQARSPAKAINLT